jgi:hypothetical protein
LELKSLQRQDVDRLLSEEYMDGLSDAPIAVLRSKRAECRRVEDLVSYLRRVVQGQIDLVVAEMELRLGGVLNHQHQLVEELPSILAGSHPPAAPSAAAVGDRPEGGTSRQATSLLAMPAATEVFAEEAGLAPDEIAAVIAPELAATTFKGGTLPGANLETFADSELTDLVERLRRHEVILSAERHILHERIDLLQAIVVERYKSGAARVETLLEEEPEGSAPASETSPGGGTP